MCGKFIHAESPCDISCDTFPENIFLKPAPLFRFKLSKKTRKPKKQRKNPHFLGFLYHGDNGIRTRDLCVANATLSQLSYVPVQTVIIIAQLE